MSAPVNLRHDPDPDDVLRAEWDTDSLRAMDDLAFDRLFEQCERSGSWGHGAALLNIGRRQDTERGTKEAPR